MSGGQATPAPAAARAAAAAAKSQQPPAGARAAGGGGAPSAPAAARMRILCLHGFTQNAATFNRRTGSLRKALK